MRPYLIIPKIITQPTWGGDYILKLKGWNKKSFYKDEKIGQTYELCGESLLSENIFDSKSNLFSPNAKGLHIKNFISKNENPPLLIKLNQAFGNSFQLHIKPSVKSGRWDPKPESWYFLEDGFITLGVKDLKKIKEYKKNCNDVFAFMQSLSKRIISGEINISKGKKLAREFIKDNDPHRFVNSYKTKKYDLIDLSMGGVHHSWEENIKEAPMGNVVFEVQLDATDDKSTMRAFDQGKIKDDGSIRKMDIDDYFQNLDTNTKANKIESMKRVRNGNTLLKTSFYSVDVFDIEEKTSHKSGGKFNHIYVRSGEVKISGGGVDIFVSEGHSCFIPFSLDYYEISPRQNNSVILKTFI